MESRRLQPGLDRATLFRRRVLSLAILSSSVWVVPLTRIMFDGEDLSTVPRRGATMIAFYVDKYSSVEVEKMFPGWSLIPINRTGVNTRNWRVLDVEDGAISPEADLESMIAEFNETSPFYKGGGRVIVYCDRSNIPSVRRMTGKYILGRDYYIWVATLDGTIATAETLGLPENSIVACQDLAENGYDSSIVFSDQWVPNALYLCWVRGTNSCRTGFYRNCSGKRR